MISIVLFLNIHTKHNFINSILFYLLRSTIGLVYTITRLEGWTGLDLRKRKKKKKKRKTETLLGQIGIKEKAGRREAGWRLDPRRDWM